MERKVDHHRWAWKWKWEEEGRRSNSDVCELHIVLLIPRLLRVAVEGIGEDEEIPQGKLRTDTDSIQLSSGIHEEC